MHVCSHPARDIILQYELPLSIYLFVYVKQFYQYSLAMYDQQQHPPTQFAKIIIIVVRLNVPSKTH